MFHKQWRAVLTVAAVALVTAGCAMFQGDRVEREPYAGIGPYERQAFPRQEGPLYDRLYGRYPYGLAEEGGMRVTRSTFEQLDADDSGRLERDEVNGALAARWPDLDADDSGDISRSEFAALELRPAPAEAEPAYDERYDPAPFHKR